VAPLMKRLLLVPALALACAHAPEAPRQSSPARPEPLPPPSSIVAVLAHRDELGLDDRQVAQLLEVQKQLEHEDAEARDRLAAPAPPPNKVQQEHGASGGRAGHRHGGSRRSDEAAARPGPVDREEAMAQAFGDNDTTAFLRAEPVFSRSQWDRARDIAERYRTDYADRREARKWPAGGQVK
jgi:hypothetical protein